MRFKNYYIQEGARQDKFFRTVAIRAYNKVKKYLKKIEDLEVDLIKVPQIEGFQFHMKNIDNTYKDLIFLIAPKKYDIWGFHQNIDPRFPNTPGIYMSFLKDSYDMTHAYTRLNKTYFVHEFIHYLDYLRRKDDMGEQQSAKSVDKGNFKKYYNNPAELNSYYQEAISQIDFLLKSNKLNIKAKEKVFSNFNTFRKFALTCFDGNFLKYVTNTNKKKIEKRLFKYYQEFK